MRSYASAYKMCVPTLPRPSQRDGSIAPCQPTSSPATESAAMGDVTGFCPRGVSSYLFFDDARSIKEVINSRERTFDEFLVLLEKAAKFKRWLRAGNPDAQMIGEYYKSATAGSWIDSLPPKSVRFLVTTLGGIAADMLFPTGGMGTMLGAGLGALDSFLLERLLKGWRPNQFIEGHLRNFTSARD